VKELLVLLAVPASPVQLSEAAEVC
jgi:hypothetical protein